MIGAVDVNAIAAAKILRQDPPRSEARVSLTVTSRAEGHVIAGVYLRAGEQTIEVYESDVRAFEAAVETDGLGDVQKRHALYQKALDDKAAGRPVADTALPRYPLSLEAVFREIKGRDMLPLTSVRRADEQRTKPAKG